MNIMVCDNVRDDINKAIKTLGYDDFVFTSIEISRINALKDCAVILSDGDSIYNYGAKTLTDLSLISNGLYDEIHNQLLSDSLLKITSYMDEVIRYSSANRLSKIFIKKYDLNILDDLIKNTQNTLIGVNNTLKNYPIKKELLETLFRKLTVYIVSGLIFIGNVSHKETLFGADIKNAIDRFNRRLDVMVSIRYTMLLQIEQMSIEKCNLESLVDNVFETVNLTIPSIKQYIRNYEMKKTMDDLNRIKDISNKLKGVL